MLGRAFAALGRLIAMSLFGAALVLALGLACAVGLFGNLICLLKGDHQAGLMLLGAGAGAWVGVVLIFDRLFAARAFLNGSSGTVSIPASSLRIDFDW